MQYNARQSGLYHCRAFARTGEAAGQCPDPAPNPNSNLTVYLNDVVKKIHYVIFYGQTSLFGQIQLLFTTITKTN